MRCASGKISPTLLSRWRGAGGGTPRCLISLDDSLCSFTVESQLLKLSNLQPSSAAPMEDCCLLSLAGTWAQSCAVETRFGHKGRTVSLCTCKFCCRVSSTQFCEQQWHTPILRVWVLRAVVPRPRRWLIKRYCLESTYLSLLAMLSEGLL